MDDARASAGRWWVQVSGEDRSTGECCCASINGRRILYGYEVCCEGRSIVLKYSGSPAWNKQSRVMRRPWGLEHDPCLGTGCGLAISLDHTILEYQNQGCLGRTSNRSWAYACCPIQCSAPKITCPFDSRRDDLSTLTRVVDKALP